MPTATPVYSGPTTVTITLASLASDTNLLIGRESTAIDQKDVTDALDVLIGGLITTGTSPTASRQIEVWAYGSYDDTVFSGSATGTDAGLTLTAETKTLQKLVTIIPTNATSNTAYQFGPFSLLSVFGSLFLPPQWGVWVVHNTGVALNATSGNHYVKFMTVKAESA